MTAYFRVYGLAVAVSGWPEVVEAVRLDYAWFEAEPIERPDVVVEIEQGAPELDRFGDLTASYLTPDGVVFRRPDRTVVDHGGRAVSVVDRGGDRLQLRGEDEPTVQGAAYYFVLGRIGRHLDDRSLVRLHSLGVVGAQGAVAILLPPGGGKTTLALRALEAEGVSLLSEDSPVLDRRGDLHPFPLRIAVAAGEGRPVDARSVQAKGAIEVESFADRVATTSAPLRHVVVGRRSLARGGRLDPLPRRAAVLPLLREGVVGVGVYQGLGYAHQRGGAELAAKLVTAARRAAACYGALAGAGTWQLTLGRDPELNWDALSPLLR